MSMAILLKTGKKRIKNFNDVYMDPEETKEVQEGRIEYFKWKRDQQFTKDGRVAEITIDLVLQARAKCRITTSTDQKMLL